MAARKLSLRKDTLSDLTTDDLLRIAGAANTQLCGITQSCVPCTGVYRSIFDDCNTFVCFA